MNEFNLEKLNKQEREELASLINKMMDEKKEWEPQKGERYWTFSHQGNAVESLYKNDEIDIGLRRMGWMFQTKEKAEFAIERQKVLAELEKYAVEHNDPETEEWNGSNVHYEIAYDLSTKELYAKGADHIKGMSPVYFSSIPTAIDAMVKVGEGRIRKYIFGLDEFHINW